MMLGAPLDYLFAFLVGGLVCLAAQLLIDLTKLTPARILVIYVVLGVVLGAVGVFEPLADLAGCGITVPLIGFGGNVARGVREAVSETGLLGALTGGLSAASDGAVGDVLLSATLLDLITYEFLKNKLGRQHKDVFCIHEHLGRVDAATAVASWRASLPAFALPELDFTGTSGAYLEAEALVHPLLTDAVPNDLLADKPILITGSNASGKSTFLKTAALAALLAQSVCTAPAKSYRASAFRLYSSMALRDDLAAGESYYIVETRSLKRILDAARLPGPLLCVVDEVLRGTNTVERIAASCELLGALAATGALCLAATHDIELCSLLSGVYRPVHFEEQVGEKEMLFDYRLREGPATSRNAIALLRLMGFDASLVENAHARADRYLETGLW